MEHLSEPEPLSAGDAELLRRAAAGDAGAFEAFVRRHDAAVFRLVRAMTESAFDAEDALQETFLAAWRAVGTFGGEASARGWILTIARNAARRLYRRRSGEPAEYVPLDELGWQAGWGTEEPPDVLYERLEDRTRLERALAALTPGERQVVVLRDLEQLSGEATARVLGLSLAAMKSRLHRARLRLAANLREGTDG